MNEFLPAAEGANLAKPAGPYKALKSKVNKKENRFLTDTVAE
jgi:hypothetical protein